MYNIIKVTATMYLFMQISTIILTLHEQQCKLTILHFTGLALFLCYVKFALICSLAIPTPPPPTTTKKKKFISHIEHQWTIAAVIFPNTIINVRLTKKKQDLLKITLCTTRKTWSTVHSCTPDLTVYFYFYILFTHN